ncbi:ATP-binding protein [Candidatus Poriferisodalis sp.]|uniref:ATP-binding protein n=1 Tax=Candidatus Poriferisodalis sp. TaxID=3101277 RepID=UPI003B0120B0
MVSEQSRGDWSDEVRVAGATVIPPDPKIMEAIGLNYALEAAIADLVDNSIDAGASQVLVRFVRRGARLVSLCVVDNGRGMQDDDLDDAMALGKRRDYKTSDLGHFGLGLKAASLGQARSLTVISRTSGSVACGRRWLKDNVSADFICDVVEAEFAATALNRSWSPLTVQSGTLVRWDGVTNFPAAQDASTTDQYLEQVLPRVRDHLGLVFHRLIHNETVSITLDIEDAEIGSTGLSQTAVPIDPFGYRRTGRASYPKLLLASFEEHSVELQCHLWPPRSELPAFKVPYRLHHKGQGFYFYRNDRLLQSGGWNGVIQPNDRYRLARVAVDVNDELAGLLSMNPEKTEIRVVEPFVHAIESAHDRDFNLRSYCDDAYERLRESRTPVGTRRPVLPPGRGFAPRLRQAISTELSFIPGADPVSIRWQNLEDDQFFRINLDNQTIELNLNYRWAVNGGWAGSLNDAPLLKATIYLLVHDLFRGEYLGAKQKDNLELWNAVLMAAAEAQAS